MLEVKSHRLPLRLECVKDLGTVEPHAWNALVDQDYPFLRHEFLHGLEQFDCLSEHGWTPVHLLAFERNRLAGALPLYLKDNSHGEFVFDWSWAEAYHRAGGRYYPKLVSAVPFTPVTGPRVLAARGGDEQRLTAALVGRAVELMEEWRLSSLHCLFPTSEQARILAQHRTGHVRGGCQYHWHNHGYRDFQDFLDALDAKRRKQIRRERREVAAAGVEIEILRGNEITAGQWRIFHDFYCSTFARKWGKPRFTLPFFQHLSRTMPQSTLLVLAKQNGHYVGGAFAMLGTQTFFGRHWGCDTFVRHLHFEICYYQTIDYCIRHGLRRLDAGAQGEHKIARGFTPVYTWSVHWLRDPGFRRAVGEFLAREQVAIDDHVADVATHSPYRCGKGEP